MYADRRTGPDGWTGSFKPASLGVALAVNGLVVGALFYAAPALNPFTPRPVDPPLETYPVPLPEPEPMHHEKIVTQQPRPAPRPDAPDTIVPIPTTDGFAVVPDPIPYTQPTGLEGTGTGTVAVDPPKPPPVIVAPGIDPRYAGDFQPAYPAQERRIGNEGRVVVRVLIGTDGRVKQVERVSATSDAFYRATLDRAVARWRFTPGTRDGVAVETWKTMSLTFVLES